MRDDPIRTVLGLALGALIEREGARQPCRTAPSPKAIAADRAAAEAKRARRNARRAALAAPSTGGERE
ncbi:hypothetical protein Mnod_3603 [Methylobacterium nodulans ORS 2060]|uniref:Uncharacterized protein n=1 Tax=Methylobacterium nodulans (strain LMG 21967 / CNCM I-2342 / ORS 2060) TaxID=460265 RepID=B8INZ6_METNO|nr:hypothetical protein Mnod_3603 [Methylobacterium nodulans ORS 2060]